LFAILISSVIKCGLHISTPLHFYTPTITRITTYTMEARHKHSGGDFTATRHSTSYEYISPLNLDLSGKHVLVTGAAWEDGVGYATATAFARAGASAIAVADVHGVSYELAERLKEAAKSAGRAEPVVMDYTVDISNLDSVQDMHETVLLAFDGRLDVVVNNAAHMEPYVPLLETDPEVYWRTYEVNVRGLFNMARVFLPTQLSTPKGLCTMINVASSGALTARPGSASYRSSKLAILRWTETLQLEYADKGLLAFCVNPGAIKTKITEMAPEEVRNRFLDRPDVAGDTIVWLAAERREWLAGRYVSCTWDMRELGEKRDGIVDEDLLKMRMAF
jgi:NAD(P)-dependent dehydrogenase (short-subunit alcohol dehydrogenase family)